MKNLVNGCWWQTRLEVLPGSWLQELHLLCFHLVLVEVQLGTNLCNWAPTFATEHQLALRDRLAVRKDAESLVVLCSPSLNSMGFCTSLVCQNRCGMYTQTS